MGSSSSDLSSTGVTFIFPAAAIPFFASCSKYTQFIMYSTTPPVETSIHRTYIFSSIKEPVLQAYLKGTKAGKKPEFHPILWELNGLAGPTGEPGDRSESGPFSIEKPHVQNPGKNSLNWEQVTLAVCFSDKNMPNAFSGQKHA